MASSSPNQLIGTLLSLEVASPRSFPSPSNANLASLPFELLQKIAGYIYSGSYGEHCIDLCSLALVSRLFRPIAQELLFQSLVYSIDSNGKLPFNPVKLLSAFKQRSSLLRYVKSYGIHCHCHYCGEANEWLKYMLVNAVNARHLSFISPRDGSNFWMAVYEAISRHPDCVHLGGLNSLVHLTLRCCPAIEILEPIYNQALQLETLCLHEPPHKRRTSPPHSFIHHPKLRTFTVYGGWTTKIMVDLINSGSSSLESIIGCDCQTASPVPLKPLQRVRAIKLDNRVNLGFIKQLLECVENLQELELFPTQDLTNLLFGYSHKLSRVTTLKLRFERRSRVETCSSQPIIDLFTRIGFASLNKIDIEGQRHVDTILPLLPTSIRQLQFCFRDFEGLPSVQALQWLARGESTFPRQGAQHELSVDIEDRSMFDTAKDLRNIPLIVFPAGIKVTCFTYGFTNVLWSSDDQLKYQKDNIDDAGLDSDDGAERSDDDNISAET